MSLNQVIATTSNKTIYRDGDKCVKIFHEPFSKTDVLREALHHARIEKIGLRVPALLEVAVIDGKWAIVSEYVEGETMAALLQRYPEKREEYMKLLVKLQRSIHHNTCPTLQMQKDLLCRRIARAPLEATLRYDLHARVEAMSRHTRLCHGGLDPHNVIFNGNGEPYMLGWNDAAQGHGAADAMHTYLFLYLADKALAELYLDEYCEASGSAREYVLRWLPMAAASMSVGHTEKAQEKLLSLAMLVDPKTV